MRFGKKRKGRKMFSDEGVNITSLMDILTVLLFFLILTLELDTLTIETPKNIQLPTVSHVKDQLEDSLKIFLSAEELRVNNEVLITLKNGQFPAKDVQGDGKTLTPLKNYLQQKVEKRQEFFKGVGQLEKLPQSKTILFVHRELPFRVVKMLLHTLTVTGHGDYQFVVVSQKGA